MAMRFHPHELELKESQEAYTCNGCNETGCGSRYQCPESECNFYLHEECTFPQTSPIPHEFFPNSTFKFFISQPKACHKDCKRICDACMQPISGFVYHCQNKDLDLHPCCINLNKEHKIGDMEFNLHNRVRGKCLWCNHKSINGGAHGDNGWSYISQCEKYHVHVACLNATNHHQKRALLLEKVKHLQAPKRDDAMKKLFLFF